MIDYFSADLEIKSVSISQRLVAGYAAHHSSIDRVRDIIDPGASAKAVARIKSPSDIGCFIGHNAASLPTGIPQRIEATPHGLYTETYILKGPAGDNLLAVAKDLMDHGLTLGMSIGYKTHDSKMEQTAHGRVRRLLDFSLAEYSFASAQAIANPQALVSAVKARRAAAEATEHDPAHDPEQEHDAMPPEHDDDDQGSASGAPGTKTVAPPPATLPNSSYLYLEDGADDDEGKRVPRSKRHLPYRDAAGALDVPQLKAAITRLGPEGALPGLDGATQARLAARARRLLEQALDGKTYDPVQEWTDGAALALDGLAYRLHDIAEQVDVEHKAMAELRQDTRGGQRMTEPARAAGRAILADLSSLLAFADAIEAGTDEQQRIAWYRQQLAHAAS